MNITVPFVAGAATLAGIAVIAPITKYALDIYPYLYANTRSSARSGMLITKKLYEELLASSTKDELFALLEDSYYSNIVEHSRDFFPFSEALEEDAHETYKWLGTIVPPVLIPVLKAYNVKFEINEIKKILNNLKEGKEIGETKFIEDDNLKLKIESAKDYQSLVAALEETPYNEMLQSKSLNELHEINTILDKYYIENLMKNIDLVKDKNAIAPFLEYVKVMIDLFNVRLVIRSMGGNISLIDNGNLKELGSIGDMAQLESVLTNSMYNEMIGEINNMNIENGFYKYLFKLAGDMAAKYTIKSGAVVKFMILKEVEVRNLNTIIKLKLEEFEQEKIREILIMS